MISNFIPSVNFTLSQEGGYQDNPADPGNWTGGKVGHGVMKGTKYGISTESYPHLDIKNLTVVEAEKIYHEDYWNPISGDLLPVGVDLMVFDFGVNAGTGESARCLQGIVGTTQDGSIGPITLAAVKAYSGDLVGALSIAHDKFYESLSTFDEFGTDWIRRVTLCTQTARKMITNAQ